MREEIRFDRAAGDYAFLSNLYPCTIFLDGREFASAEHAYQYGKPNRPEIAEWLAAAPTASLCAQAARALTAWQSRPDWHAAKVDRMRVVLRAKFDQHPDLARQLVATGERPLVEASGSDPYWGIDRSGRGENRLGELLMEMRAALRSVVGR